MGDDFTTRLWHFKRGMKDAIPIFLGYIAVSFTFGIAAKNSDLTVFQATLVSLTNLTSAGQFASLGIIAASASYLEMALTQLVINLRYCLMSSTLSQKVSPKLPFLHRAVMSFGVTDEIFALAAGVHGELSPYYCYGMMASAIPGWTLGTFFGVALGNILPDRLLSALGVALYGMFIAIIIPPARKNRVVTGVVAISMAASALFTYLPVVREISSGFRIIILTLVIAAVAALLFPIQEAEEKEADCE
jgi:predicted branched-subunit amino acid permease